MKYEIVILQDAQVIGMSKEIAFNNPSGCSKFWGEERCCGTDINSPDYQCGMMMPLAD